MSESPETARPSLPARRPRASAPRPPLALGTALGTAVVFLLVMVLSVACGSGGDGDDRSATAAPGGSSGTPSAGAATGSATGSPQPGARPPNIVFVLTDDLSWNLVGRMPEVTKMRKRGVTFANYYVSESLCCPSRSTILTGRYPHNTGVLSNDPPTGGFEMFYGLGLDKNTIGTALQAKGYRTGFMGKYLNGYDPSWLAGQRRSYIPPGWNDWVVSGSVGYEQYGYRLNENGRVVQYGHRPQDYLTDVLAAKSVDFVKRSVAEGKPFFLELSTYAVHHPYVPAPRHAKAFPRAEEPRTPAFDERDMSDKPPWLRKRPPLTQRQIATADERYRKRAQSALSVDEAIGDIQRQLTALGVTGRTYVIFSSDNGFHLGERRLPQGKMTAYGHDIRVPLIVTGPGVPAGHTVTALTQNTDLAPTFLQIGGASLPTPVDGRSLLPLLRTGTATNWRTTAFIEHRRPVFDPTDPDSIRKGDTNPPTYRAIRTLRELYVEYEDGEREYYNLAADPYELQNLYDRLPAARRAKLSAALWKLNRCSGADCMTVRP